MANKFTEIQHTPFVPTYQPINSEVVASVATNMQAKQNRGIEAYDKFDEAVEDYYSQIGEADKPILQEKVASIKEGLSQFEETGDFINAQPAIRRGAKEFEEYLRRGEGARMLSNFANKTANVKAIRERDDIPMGVRDKLINQQLEQDEGVQAGTKIGQVMLPGDWIDWEEEAMKWSNDIEPQTLDEVGIQTQTREFDDPFNPGEKIKRTERFNAKSKRKMRTPDVIEAVINYRLHNNDKFQEQKALEAQAHGFTGDDVQRYIESEKRDIINTAITTNTVNDQTYSNVDMGELSSSDPYQKRYTIGAGIATKTITPEKADDLFATLKDAHDYKDKDPQTWQDKKIYFNSLLASMVSHDIISNKEMVDAKKELEKNNYEIRNLQTPENIRDQTVFSYNWGEKVGGDNEILRGLYEKTQEFIDQNPSFAPNNITLSDKTDLSNFKYMLGNTVNDRSFDIVNTNLNAEELEKEFPKIRRALDDNRTNVSLSYQDNGEVYFSISREVEKESGEEETQEWLIKEKLQSPEVMDRSVTFRAADMFGGPESERIKNGFILKNVDWWKDGNLLEQLPKNMRPKSVDHLNLIPVEGSSGINVKAGDRVIDNFEFYASSAKQLRESGDPKAFQRWAQLVDELDTRYDNALSQDVKTWMLQNMAIPSEIENEEFMNNPYTFSSPVEGVTFIK